MNIDSFELSEFNLNGAIVLDEKFGLSKIIRSPDGKLVLIRDGDWGAISASTPTLANISDLDSALGFVLDIGIRKEKALTMGHGFYFGHELIPHFQSSKQVSQSDFDAGLLEEIVNTINTKYHSRYSRSQRKALQLNHLLGTYNEARLLYPNFYTNSYLGLFRILDALSGASGSYDFAVWAAEVSSDLNKEIYRKITDMEVMSSKLQLATTLFARWSGAYKYNRGRDRRDLRPIMSNLSRYGQLVFVCFYSAYQYRSKFVHQGFPFPKVVIESFGRDDGTNYISSAFGASHVKIFRPDGLQGGDTIDIHSAITLRHDETYQDYEEYFKLIPSWHWLKRLTRAAVIKEAKKLALYA